MGQSESKKTAEKMLMSVNEYLLNKYKRRFGFSMTIKPDGNHKIFSLATGEEFTEEEINDIYPSSDNLNARENVDGRNSFLHGKKSY